MRRCTLCRFALRIVQMYIVQMRRSTLCRCADVHCAGLHCALCRCAGQQTMATARARLILCWTLHRNSSGITRLWTWDTLLQSGASTFACCRCFCHQEAHLTHHENVSGGISPHFAWCFLFRGSNQFQANTSLSFGVSNVVFENIRSIVEMGKLIGGNYARPSRSISGRQWRSDQAAR